VGPSIKAYHTWKDIDSASLLYFSSRDEAANMSVDTLLQSDVLEVLGGSARSDSYAVYFDFAETAVTVAKGNDRHAALAVVPVAPTACEIASIVPLYSISNTRIGCVGLVDKYANLAAISSVQVQSDKLVIRSKFRGVVGLIASASKLTVTDGNHLLQTVIFPIGEGLWLHRTPLPASAGPDNYWEVVAHP
jgi:hypothetical protein